MKRLWLIFVLLGLPALPAHAGTCLSQSSTPTFQAGQSVPTVCDTHGTQKVMTVDANGDYAAGGGSGNGAILDGVDTGIKATVKDYANSNPLSVVVVDTNGDAASLAGGTQYDEDAAETAGAKLTMAGTVRRDTAASSAGTTGDNATLNTDSTGRLWVRPTGGVTPADNFAVPTDAITVWSINGCYDGSAIDLCVKGSAGAGAVDSSTARVTLASDDPSFTGDSLNHHISVGTTEDETEIKASAGRLMSISITNSAATVAYFRCANLTAANTTPGTSTVFYGLAVPGATTGAGLTVNFGPRGIAFSTALTCWVVTGKAESDVAEVAANDIQWNIQYK